MILYLALAIALTIAYIIIRRRLKKLTQGRARVRSASYPVQQSSTRKHTSTSLSKTITPKAQRMNYFIKQLGPKLRDRYGHKSYYSPEQVKQTIAITNYTAGDDCYALSMFCSEDDFNTYHRSIGESCDYGMMRQEVVEMVPMLAEAQSSFDMDYLLNISETISSNDCYGSDNNSYDSYSDSSSYDSYSDSGSSDSGSYDSGSSDSGSSWSD
jgi:hypothetical protein